MAAILIGELPVLLPVTVIFTKGNKLLHKEMMAVLLPPAQRRRFEGSGCVSEVVLGLQVRGGRGISGLRSIDNTSLHAFP